ncbi:hypothetical protein [Pontibacter liquoris]|uniref:hypothetical protein n=1 Tax=Pontibacter liquoris TaxID=2905677 RepID=UPI001FA75F93|nr:hypothetical protein [Pontibacter liquoris]
MDRRESLRALLLGGFPNDPAPGATLPEREETHALITTNSFRSRWETLPDAASPGEAFRAWPPEDWLVQEGELLCRGGGPDRTVQLLTHRLSEQEGAFILSTQIRFWMGAAAVEAGWRISIAGGGVLDVGVQRGGELFIGTVQSNRIIPGEKLQQPVRLLLKVWPLPQGGCHARLTALDTYGNTLCVLKSTQYGAESWQGSIALLSHSPVAGDRSGKEVSFRYWEAAGERLVAQEHPE